MRVVHALLTLMGFHPAMVLFVGGLNLTCQFWIHTGAIGRMPRWCEAVMNTPSHHRAHHGRNPRYLDCNHAGVFIARSRLFGTFVPDLDADKPGYGLVHNLGTLNAIRVAFHEWVDLSRDTTQPGLTWRARPDDCVMPRGWSHDGSRITSPAIKARHVADTPETAGTSGLPPVADHIAQRSRAVNGVAVRPRSRNAAS